MPQNDRFRESIKKYKKTENSTRCRVLALCLGLEAEHTHSQARVRRDPLAGGEPRVMREACVPRAQVSCDFITQMFQRMFENLPSGLEGISEYLKPGQGMVFVDVRNCVKGIIGKNGQPANPATYECALIEPVASSAEIKELLERVQALKMDADEVMKILGPTAKKDVNKNVDIDQFLELVINWYIERVEKQIDRLKVRRSAPPPLSPLPFPPAAPPCVLARIVTRRVSRRICSKSTTWTTRARSTKPSSSRWSARSRARWRRARSTSCGSR